MTKFFLLIPALFLLGCGSGDVGPGQDAGVDAGSDAGMDAGGDAPQDGATADADAGGDDAMIGDGDGYIDGEGDGHGDLDAGGDDEPECQVSADCPAERPICGLDFACRGCQHMFECLAREGVSEGFVCELTTGECLAGDCYPNQAPCDAIPHGICENYTCRPCNNPAGAQTDDCRDNGYPDTVLCAGGECVNAECNTVIECAFSRVCLDHTCVDCVEGDESYCTDQGMNCDTDTHNCVGCVDDSQCSGGQRICDNNSCRDCLPGECGAGRVCAGGGCFDGDCWIDSQIWQDGQTEPGDPCSVCNREVTQFAFSANPNAPCDDWIDCTWGDVCSTTVAGVCAGQAYSCPSLPCADPVCGGTGPTDCSLARKPSWIGCFIGEACYSIGDPNPGNGCQFCDGNVDDWTDKPLNTSCGHCLACQDVAGGIACAEVADGEDTNNDCFETCEVCDGSGGCRWVAAGEADPDPNACVASHPTECGQNGLCQGGGPDCDFWSGVPGVSDGNECTENDRCDGEGGFAADPVANGTLCETSRVCYDAVCRHCLTGTYDCPTVPDQMVCQDGNCIIGDCVDAADCGTPPECKLFECVSNRCRLQDSSVGSCDDENPCTVNDYCLDGACQPGADEPDCSSADDQCNTGICVVVNPDTYTCEKDPLPPGTSCDADGLSCSIDQCDGGKPGACNFSSIVANQCLISGSCYDMDDLSPSGCGICRPATSQTQWQTLPTGTACGNDPCDQICSGMNCINRWTNGTCFFPISCILDRSTDKYYYWSGYCPGGCGCTRTYFNAESACATYGTRLPTRADYAEMHSTVNCTTKDCSDPTIDIGVDPVFNGRVQGGVIYWTREYPWVVVFVNSGTLEFTESNPSNEHAFLCIEE